MENERARLAWWRRFIHRDPERRDEVVISWRDGAANAQELEANGAQA